MKKIVVTLMCALLATSLVACGKTSADPTASTDPDNTYVSETGLGDGIDNITGDTSTITPVGVAKAILLDETDYKITLDDKPAKYTKKETGYNDGMLFSLTIENNTDQNVSFCFKDIKVNGEEMLLTEGAALSEMYGTEVSANDSGFAGLLVPFQSLYASEITTIENVSFIVEVYPVTGSYGEFGELLYASDEITFETIEGYEGEGYSDDEEEDDEDEDFASSYTYTEVTLEEQILLDDSNLKISTTGDITYEEGYAQRIGLSIENKTDSDLMIQSEYIQVNGYSQTTYLWVTVPANDTLETSIDLLYYDLMLSKIDTIATVEFVISVGIGRDYVYDPITIETSAADYEQPNEFEGTTIYNDNGIEIIALDCVYEFEYFTGPVFYIHNQSGSRIDIRMENVTINGIPVSKGGESHLADNMYHVRCSDYSGDMYENNIDTIDEMTFDLTIYDDSFKTIVDGESISISY